MSELTGKTIGHYHILELIGQGGMGVVYRAHDTRLDRIVALKFLPYHLTANEAEKARFLQEARAASALNHPNVCTVFDIQEAGMPDRSEKQEFIVMEFVDGVTLRKKLPVRNQDEVLGYAIQIGEALQEAHSKSIVHRDVKSENIMVNSKNQIKVMDFGLAKLKGSLKLTKTSSTVGTLAYMAPEQIQGGTVDARSDIFSFGIVLFELLTGTTPFRGEHEAAVVYSIVNEEPERVSRFRPDVDPEIERIVQRALEKDPEDRYQSAADMVSELRRVRKQSSRVSRTMARPVTLPEPNVSADEMAGVRSALPDTAPMKKVWILAAMVLLIALTVGGYFLLSKHAEPIDSLAVLPLVNSTADPNAEYLSDGITESMINSLTRIKDLKVIPRSTVFRFKGKDVDPQEVGKKLNVRAVLSGRLVQRGNEIEIQLDLVDVQNQSQIWGDHFQRNVADVISLQNEIVGKVSKQLQLTLNGETEREVAKRYTENPEAYKLYLQGRYYWNKRRGAEILKAIEFFKQAIALDPGYAMAYAGLADCYLILEQYTGRSPKESLPAAEAAARKALELDNTLGEVHASLGFIREYNWDWDGAEKEFKTAIEMSPNYATAYHWYTIFLLRARRCPEGYAVIRKAQELDPLSPVILLNVANVAYRCNNDFATAEEMFQKSIDLDQTFGPAYAHRGHMHMYQKKLREALPDLEKGVELSGRTEEYLSYLGSCLARMGDRAKALNILQELQDRYRDNKGSAYNVARLYVGLDDREKAFEWLDRAYVDHSGWISWLTYDFDFDVLKDDPRYEAILKKVGLAK